MEQAQLLDQITFENIHNQNEKRVIELLPEVLAEFKGYEPNKVDFEDIYALTLNKLPARYMQAESYFFEDFVTDEMIQDALREAIDKVFQSPTIQEDELSLGNE